MDSRDQDPRTKQFMDDFHRFQMKPAPEVTVQLPPVVENPVQIPSGWDWASLMTVKGHLKVGQVIATIVSLSLIRPDETCVDQQRAELLYTFIFVNMNTLALTLIILADTVARGRLLKGLFTPAILERAELWLTGLATALIYFYGYWVVIYSASCYYPKGLNIASGSVGFISGLLYLVDWGRVFRNRFTMPN
ncbi:uncharacterized protein LOC129748669 [Uranotaenia lowii]|uniref:uncharacterized protein LOC129748669 n=1 Tax=Uranotaenia lowii TaxID=190385 RepID=UPI0024789F7A|nr:uncharacterized protein LOC129748669 [Uranotaenia lowii]